MNDRRIGLAVLAFLIVLDLVLIGLALRPASSATASTVPTPSAAPVTESAPAPTSIKPVPARLMAFRSGGVAYAATPGSCGGTAATAIEIPSTGAAVPAAVPGAVVGRLASQNDGTMSAVAGAQDCSGAQQYSQGAGGAWSDSGSPSGLYFYFPGATNIATPAGSTPIPCSVTSLVAPTDQATVLCDDGRLFQSSGGAAWETVGSAPAGVALAPGAEATLHALQVADGCDGLSFTTSTDRGRNWAAGGCVQGATATGPVGVSVLFDTVVVVDGAGDVFRSPDLGATFTKGG